MLNSEISLRTPHGLLPTTPTTKIDNMKPIFKPILENEKYINTDGKGTDINLANA